MERASGFVETWKAVMFRPGEFFAAEPSARSTVGPVRFTLVVALVATPASMVAGALVGGAEIGAAIGRALAGALLGPIAAVASLYLVAGLTHLLLRILGSARRPFDETLACFGYAYAPVIFGVVPVLGLIVGAVWQLVLLFIGLRRVQNASGLVAVVAIGSLPVFSALLAIGLRIGVVEAFKLPSGSMIPTLRPGDHVFVTKYAYKFPFGNAAPKPSDVITFRFPENRAQDFIKRVVAVPGDTFEALDGRPILNGRIAPECDVGPYTDDEGHAHELYVEFLGGRAYLTQYEAKHEQAACSNADPCASGLSCRAGLCGVLQGPWHVAGGEVWVMGDNRNNSHDSRMWRGGLGAGVPFDDVKGRVSIVWMSFAERGGIVSERVGFDVHGAPMLPAAASTSLKDALARCLAHPPGAT